MPSPLLDDFHIYDRPELNDKALVLLAPHLDASTLRWAARPKQGILRRRGVGCLILFFWGFLIFSAVWTLLVYTMASSKMAIFGLPFILIGSYMTLVWPLHDAWRRRNVAYGLSEDHLYLFRKGQLQSFPLDSIQRVVIEHQKDKRGDLVFTNKSNYTPDKNQRLFPSTGLRLRQIDQVEQIHDWLIHAS